MVAIDPNSIFLSGDGNENGQKKKSVDLISEKTQLHVQHPFLYISLPLFCTITMRNFQKLPSYSFYVFLLTFFSLPLIFTLVAASISPFFFNSYVFLPTKLVSFVFCLALALSLLFTSMLTLKLSQNKESALLLLFLSLKVREAM